MAIDTKSISQLIAEFRKQTAKDSITPESLGSILARLLTLINEAAQQSADLPRIPSFRYDDTTRALFITY